jgi:hypothetical protein
VRHSRHVLLRTVALLFGVLASLGAAYAGDSTMLTWEEQRYVEAAVKSLPAECRLIEGKIKTEKHEGRRELLQNRLRDLKEGKTPVEPPELDLQHLKVGQIGRLCGCMTPTRLLGPGEALVEAVPQPQDVRSNQLYAVESTTVIVTGTRFRETDLNPSVGTVVINDFVVVERRRVEARYVYVLRPLCVDVPRLTNLVHRKLQRQP